MWYDTAHYVVFNVLYVDISRSEIVVILISGLRIRCMDDAAKMGQMKGYENAIEKVLKPYNVSIEFSRFHFQ